VTLTASLYQRISPSFTLDVALEAPPGFSIVFGASGSGKTTLLRCVAGLATPDRGRVAIADDVLFDSEARRSVATPHRRVGYVFQQLALFPHLSVGGNLAYGLSHIGRDERRARAKAIAESFRIAHLLKRRPGAISGGERQRVALARALVTDPAALLLDEPLSALDHATQSRIIDDLRQWNAERRIPILYVTHSHREVFALGERVFVLDAGRVVAGGTPHDVLEAPSHEIVAELAGFENFFTGRILSRRPDAGVMTCRLDPAGTVLEVPLSRSDGTSSIRIAIRAGDILLANREPQGLSARNVLEGTVTTLRREGPTVIAEVDAGERFVVHLTPGALDALHVAVGTRVWLVIKTHSCRVVTGDRP
jgi:molybdate transport system ATP-binding protein